MAVAMTVMCVLFDLLQFLSVHGPMGGVAWPCDDSLCLFEDTPGDFYSGCTYLAFPSAVSETSGFFTSLMTFLCPVN